MGVTLPEAIHCTRLVNGNGWEVAGSTPAPCTALELNDHPQLRSINMVTKNEANETARKLTEDDEDGWIYEAVHPAHPKSSFLQVYDENGVFLGKLSTLTQGA